MSGNPALLWLGRDLRIADNPALECAIAQRCAVIPVFIWAPEEDAPWSPGAASRWWLHHSLRELAAALSARGSRLIVRRGPTEETLLALAAECGAKSIFWNRRYEPASIAQERALERRIREQGIAAEGCPGNLLFEPGSIVNTSGKPFQVFSAFWRACLTMPLPAGPKRVTEQLPAPTKWPASIAIADLGLEPRVDWAGGIRESWRPGETAAVSRMKSFLKTGVESYSIAREHPDRGGTSRLSAHLHFGEINVRQIWSELLRKARTGTDHPAEGYLRQLAWREFSYHLLFHFPETTQQPLRPKYRFFPWRMDVKGFRAWTKGKTGYPLIDAGMRELWHTGWMHNRVRMATASFLVKHLMIPWQEGAAWFWDTLVDADLANNTMGWQWSAGCGADAAPYFRIFNPVVQGEKFDPNGDYVRRWVPELARVSAKWIHRPWEAPRSLLLDAGVELGKNYPRPMVDHRAARARALGALKSLNHLPALAESG